jgi:hypothetical protein
MVPVIPALNMATGVLSTGLNIFGMGEQEKAVEHALGRNIAEESSFNARRSKRAEFEGNQFRDMDKENWALRTGLYDELGSGAGKAAGEAAAGELQQRSQESADAISKEAGIAPTGGVGQNAFAMAREQNSIQPYLNNIIAGEREAAHAASESLIRRKNQLQTSDLAGKAAYLEEMRALNDALDRRDYARMQINQQRRMAQAEKDGQDAMVLGSIVGGLGGLAGSFGKLD